MYTSEAHSNHELSLVIIPLLKGVVYQNESPAIWNTLLNMQTQVQDYTAVLGMKLILDEAEGYAFLQSYPVSDDTPPLPRLVARRQLSYPVSLLLALLRKKLAEFDAGGGDVRLILSREDIAELVRVFLPESSNEVKIINQMDAALSKIADMGFIRKLRGEENMFEVRRIIKAFVDAQWLSDFDTRLSEYRQHIAGKEDSFDD